MLTYVYQGNVTGYVSQLRVQYLGHLHLRVVVVPLWPIRRAHSRGSSCKVLSPPIDEACTFVHEYVKLRVYKVCGLAEIS